MSLRFGLALPGLACLAVGSWCLAIAAPISKLLPARPGALVCSEGPLDLGALGQGVEAPLHFRVRNVAKQPVQLLRVDTSCGCTQPAPTVEVIQPGEDAEISAVWKLGGARGAAQSHLFVTYSVGEEARQVLELAARAEVEPDVVVTPGAIELGAFGPDVSVEVSPGRATEFEVLDVWTNCAAIKVDWTPGARRFEVSLDPSKSFWPSTPECAAPAISIRTDRQHEPIIKVPVRRM
ncbi:MAG: DUF1573 domain-containing protein [Pirellulales bacterium]